MGAVLRGKRPQDFSEKEFDALLFGSQKGVATLVGWQHRYHVLRSKGSAPGFPDRVLVRERVVFVETKTEKGVVSDHQQRWLTALAAGGAEVYLWRPSDLEEASEVLARRWTFLAGALSRAGVPLWTPASLWLSAGHRYDEAPYG